MPFANVIELSLGDVLRRWKTGGTLVRLSYDSRANKSMSSGFLKGFLFVTSWMGKTQCS